MPHVIVLEARIHKQLADVMFALTQKELEKQGYTCTRITVPSLVDLADVLEMSVEYLSNVRHYIALGAIIESYDPAARLDYTTAVNALSIVARTHQIHLGLGLSYMENLDNVAPLLYYKSVRAVASCLQAAHLRKAFENGMAKVALGGAS